MSDQMPDEVWACPSAGVVCTGTWWSFQHEEDRNAVRYIRADLCDSRPCPHVVGETTQHCTLAQDQVGVLRAALIRIADYERNWMESGEVALEDVQSMAREALGDG